MKFFDLKLEAFGLEINDFLLKIVKLSTKGKNISISSFGDFKIENGVVEQGIIKDQKALSEIIKSACSNIKGKKLNTKYVVASLPEEQSFLQVIQMPKMTEEELKTAVPFEAENYIPMPIDQVYLDFEAINTLEDSDHSDVLVVATPKQIVDSYVSCIKSAGLVPVAFEVESESIMRAVIKNKKSQSPLFVIDIGDRNTGFIIFAEQSIRFTNSVPISAQQLSQNDSERFKQQLINEVEKCINFYKSHVNYQYTAADSGIKIIVLTGTGGSSQKAIALLKEKILPNIEVGNPFINLSLDRKSNIKPEEFLTFTTAIGLAMRGVDIKKRK